MAGLRGKKAEKELEEVLETEIEKTEKAEKPKVEKVKEVEVQEVVVEEKSKAQPNVRVKLKQDLRTYIGDQWYSFSKGVVTTVPQQVKDILAKANLLDAL